MRKYVSILFVLLYLITAILPGFGAVDRIAFHWLYLSIISSISLTYVITTKSSSLFLRPIKEYMSLKIMILFFLICCLSITFSINIDESLISIKRLFILLISLINLNYHIEKIKNINVILGLVGVLIMYETSLPFMRFLEINQIAGGYKFAYANELETFAPNKNITAAIIGIHLALIFYLSALKNKFLKILIYTITFISSINIVLISARAVIISILGSLFLILFSHLYFKTKIRKSTVLFFGVMLIGFLTINFFLGSSNDVSLNNRLTTVNTDDASTNQRLRFYKHGFDHILQNPLIGVGIGNWKLKSIEYDSENLTSYIIPYHLHNDFLQYGTETGIIGMIIYLSLFLYLFKVNIYSIKSNYFLSISLTIALMVFFIDSNLNFPHHRPAMMILLALIMILTELNKKNRIHA